MCWVLSGCNLSSLEVASYFLSLSTLCLIELGLVIYTFHKLCSLKKVNINVILKTHFLYIMAARISSESLT